MENVNEELNNQTDVELDKFSEYVRDKFAATFGIPKKYLVDEYEREYNRLLNSGMFWEFYPQLSGDYETDKAEWKIIYKQLKKSRSK